MQLQREKINACLFFALTLVFLFSNHPAQADPQKGEALYKQRCLACHAITRTEKIAVEKRAAIKGMPLWFAGSKFKKEWLETWLASPKAIFGVKWGTLEKGAYDHPLVDASQAADLSDYLMTLVDTKIEQGTTDPLPKSRGKRKSMLGKSRQLFEKHQGCYACHSYVNRRHQVLGGFSGPSMVDAAKRLNPDWVYAFLKDPERYYPNGTCPIPGESAFNQFTDRDRAALATYITNMGVK